MSSSKDDISRSIKNAIKAGQDQYNEKQRKINLDKKAEQDRIFEQRRQARIYAERWVRDTLPGKIKEQTAAGRNSLDVSEYQAAACKDIPGIRVEEHFVQGSSGEENMYATDDHWEYVIYW